MRFRGLCHVELNVPNYENAIQFFDRMFGWLGYSSFSTLGIGYISTYYTAFPHSYIGIQPSRSSEHLEYEKMCCGINHVALWAKSRHEVDSFYADFLKPQHLVVLDPPDWCPEYSPGYYTVFFLDPYGIRWELAHVPLLPSPVAILKWWRTLSRIGKKHTEWKRHPFFESQRRLPRRSA
jgi:catechol 2,3-dioxygenase-like lactoylglutathione lyase family enzyme